MWWALSLSLSLSACVCVCVHARASYSCQCKTPGKYWMKMPTITKCGQVKGSEKEIKAQKGWEWWESVMSTLKRVALRIVSWVFEDYNQFLPLKREKISKYANEGFCKTVHYFVPIWVPVCPSVDKEAVLKVKGDNALKVPFHDRLDEGSNYIKKCRY